MKRAILRRAMVEVLENRVLLAADFTVAAMSDTQYTVETFPQTFAAQTQWAADHASDPNYNVAFLAHQGDMLRRGYSNYQAANAAAALNTLNGVVPYLADIGNHDFDNQFDDLDHHISSANFTSWFGDARYQALYGDNYGSSLDQRNKFTTFTAGGQKYLVLSIEWEAEDSAIAWAQGVINSHRQLPVILTTHEYLNGSGRTTSPLDPLGNSGESIFQKLVKPNPQIFLVLSGHTGAIRHQTSTDAAGLPVFETVGDFEGRPIGGDGYLQLFHFYPDQNTINVSSYSPTLNQFDTSSSTYQFSLPLNFSTRFAFANGPIANDDGFVAPAGQEIDANALANDSDSGGNILSASLVSGPAHGSLAFNADGSFAYVPDAGYSGDDAFTYSVTDGLAQGNTAQVQIHINAAPAAQDDAATTVEGKPITLNVSASDADADGNALRPILMRLPAHGAVFANADGTFTYTPDPRFTGVDGFSYAASDGIAISAVAQVSITVSSSPPVYNYPIAETTTYGTRTGSYLNLTASDGVEESIKEISRSGSAVLDQRWQFNVTAGTDISLVVNAHRSWGTDEYHFQYSTNGSTWSDLTQIVPASSKDVTRVLYDADEPYQMWKLPATTQGNVWIRATDTKSNSDLCTLSVDEMFIRTIGAAPIVPPNAPSNLKGSYTKSTRKAKLTWTDNSANETGFHVSSSTDNGASWQLYTTLGANSTTFTTSALTKGRTYLFKLSAYNSAGDSLFSNTVSVLAN